MENLEKILQNKRKIIIASSIILITAIIGIIVVEKNKKEGTESIDILSSMEEEINGQVETKKLTENAIVNEQNNVTNQIEEEVAEEKIAIHITGEVKKTGILYLEKGSRIADAIKAVGGATKSANLNQVNLAYVLEDGQKIYIPNKKEKIQQGAYIVTNSGENVLVEEGNSNLNYKTGTNKAKGEKSKVNINTANQTELETLPGIGSAIAQKIIEYRESNGKFEKIEEIQNVKGIGDSKYNNIKELICV